MDIFPIIQQSVAISTETSLLIESLGELALWFLALPYLLWRPLVWVLTYIGLWVKTLWAQDYYIKIYQSHLPPENAKATYKLPVYPGIYGGQIKPRGWWRNCLDPVGFMASKVPLTSILPWRDSRLLGGKLDPVSPGMEGIRIRRSLFSRTLKVDFYQKVTAQGNLVEWQCQSTKLKPGKDIGILFNSQYRLHLKEA